PARGIAHRGESLSPPDPGPQTAYLPVVGDLAFSTAETDAAALDRERTAALQALRHPTIPGDDYLVLLDRILHGLRRL
ncbi:hypothetical protein K7G98_35995, partial [Saccharothrix sp. MB29]|nr:hypothetical protein [Saccharothrix sp. MB29]